MKVFSTTVCGRLAQIQPVHVCAGNLVPLSNVSGQIPLAFDYADGALEQGDRQFLVLSTDGGRASSEPEAIDPAPGLRQSPNEPKALRKTLPKNHSLPKADSDSSESAIHSIGRWRTSIPKSWKKKTTPQVIEAIHIGTPLWGSHATAALWNCEALLRCDGRACRCGDPDGRFGGAWFGQACREYR